MCHLPQKTVQWIWDTTQVPGKVLSEGVTLVYYSDHDSVLTRPVWKVDWGRCYQTGEVRDISAILYSTRGFPDLVHHAHATPSPVF